MVALVDFTAAQSKKYLRITDRLLDNPDPKTSPLLEIGKVFTFRADTFEHTTGSVKVEVSSDGQNFATHVECMSVVQGAPYPIDDSKLPKAKK